MADGQLESARSQLHYAKRTLRKGNDDDEETAYESYMNPEPGFQSGPGGAVDAD